MKIHQLFTYKQKLSMKTEFELKTTGQRIRHFRILLNLSQQKLANVLDISQSTLSQIENDHYSLSIEGLQHLQKEYQLNCIWLISGEGHVFLTKDNRESEAHESLLFENTNGFSEPSSRNGHHRMVDIPLIDKEAAPKYIKNYDSPQYLTTLKTYQVPGFEYNKNHLIFEVEGNSMYPTFQPKDFLVCSACDNLSDFESGDLIVVILEDGILSKRIYISKEDPTYYILKNDNPDYNPFFVKIADIIELWKVKGRITTNLYQNIKLDEKKISKLEYDIEFLKEQIEELMNALKYKQN